MPSNSGLVTVEMLNLMAGDKFRGSWLTTATSFARENDPKRLIWSFITLNLEKVCIWRFSADDVSMTSWRGPGTEVTWLLRCEPGWKDTVAVE